MDTGATTTSGQKPLYSHFTRRELVRQLTQSEEHSRQLRHALNTRLNDIQYMSRNMVYIVFCGGCLLIVAVTWGMIVGMNIAGVR